MSREELGKIVRDVWVATAKELLEFPAPSWLVPWEEPLVRLPGASAPEGTAMKGAET